MTDNSKDGKSERKVSYEVSELSMSSESTLTDVDLGEDLVEKTATLTRTRSHAGLESRTRAFGSGFGESARPIGGAELLENARILFGEGLIEDAKALLRKALIQSPEDAAALGLLREIQEEELRRMMRESPTSISRAVSRSINEDLRDPDEVIAALDSELKLGILESTSLFQEELIRPEVVEASMAGASAQDLLDLGVGFLGLGLHEIAIRLFQAAQREQAPGAVECLHSSSALLAEAQLEAGLPYDAMASMQVILRDPQYSPGDKLQFFYLMGRACEALEQHDTARQWFGQVVAHDPSFRDAQERLDRNR